MGQIGTTQQQRKELAAPERIFDDQITLKEGENLHRVIQGPQKTRTLFYPTIVEKEEDGETILAHTYRALNFVETPPLIESLIEAENSVRTAMGQVTTGKNTKEKQRVEVGFRPQLRFWYLAIDVLDNTDIKVKPVRYPKTVKDAINDLETQKDLESPDYLLNGMFYLYNIVIKKIIDPKIKLKQFATSYKCTLYGDNPFRGRVPVEFLKMDPGEVLEQLGGMSAVFPEKFVRPIEENEINLSEVLKPHTESEIKEMFQKFPVNLLGRRANTHAFYFPQSDEFKEMIESLGLPVVQLDPTDETQKSTTTETTSGVKLKSKETLEKEKETESTEETKTETKEPVDPPGGTEAAPKLKTKLKLKDVAEGETKKW
jgi:hypothetical protein